MMSSRSSRLALGLGSQPSCSTPVPEQRNFPALPLLPARSRPLAMLSQEGLESFSGSSSSVRDALGADLLGCNYSIPDPQLIRKIVSQVEFYLSDENLAKDAFLLKHVQKNKMGFVSIKLLTSFKKVKYLTRDWRLTLYALRFSELLEVNEEGTKVRRRVPVPESLLSIPPSKLLLAWELLPREQEAPPPPPKSFLETITRLFGPFGAIASIRILRPGRKLPADVRKFASRFPELLSRSCALVEYESLESARRAFEELGRQSRPGGESIRVVRLSGKASKKKPGAEKEEEEELPDPLGLEPPGWREKGAAAAVGVGSFPFGLGDPLLCGPPEPEDPPVSPPPLLSEDPPVPTWPRDFGGALGSSLFSSKVFPPLGSGLGAGGCFGLCLGPKSPPGRGWGDGVGSWALWGGDPSTDARRPLRDPPAARRVPEPPGLRDAVLGLPRGPDGARGSCGGFGRGELVLRH